MDKQITLFTPELPLPALRTINRALVLLEQYLREPGCGIHLHTGNSRLAQAENGNS
jgi:hypothetical protein